MFGGAGLGPVSKMDTVANAVTALVGVASLFALHVAEHRAMTPKFTLLIRRWEGPLARGMIVAVIGWLLILPKANVNPFIYFRF